MIQKNLTFVLMTCSPTTCTAPCGDQDTEGRSLLEAGGQLKGNQVTPVAPPEEASFWVSVLEISGLFWVQGLDHII